MKQEDLIKCDAFTGPVDEMRHALFGATKNVPSWREIAEDVQAQAIEMYGERYKGRYSSRNGCFEADQRVRLPAWWIGAFCATYGVSMRRYFEVYERYVIYSNNKHLGV